MAHIEFTDADGVRWQAWDVVPQSDALAPGVGPAGAARGVPTPMRDGWLAFQSDAGETRRLYPIPPRWYEGGEAGVRELHARAMVVPTERRQASRRLGLERRILGDRRAEDAASPPPAKRTD